MSDNLIRLHNISFSYSGETMVLDGLDFTLAKSEKIGLVGPNGCGKTTLFYLMMGLVKPESGTLEMFGRQISGEKDFRQIREKVGFLFQNSDDQLFSPTIMEDVAFGPLNLGKSREEVRTIVDETLMMLGIGGFENRVSHKLSHGEKKLVALATVLAMKPEVLILDEPTAGLDEAMTGRLVNILNELNLPSVVTSHDMDFLTGVTDKIHGMSEGRILPEDQASVHSHIHVHKGGIYPHTHSDLG
jgi:cobalt/nickel transport system ATP-binding protein